MTKKLESHITPFDGNIFADIGFNDKKAAKLLAEAEAIVAPKLAIKAELMSEVRQWIVVQNLKQEKAAEILHISRPRVSDVVNKKVTKFTIDALVDMVARTGKNVSVAIR